MRAFVKSVVIGALAPALPFLFLTTFIAFGIFNHDGRLLDALWLALLPVIITLPIVTLCAVLIGLPLTRILHRFSKESHAAYVGGGGIAGVAVVIAALLAMSADEGFWLAWLGALGGAITGHRWWIDGREPVLRSQGEID